jgi:hypothetical protein
MAVGMETQNRGVRGLERNQEQATAYRRAALIAAPLIVALAALAVWASTLAVTTGTIVLFDPEQLAFWLAGVALTIVAGVVAGRFALRARPDETGLAPRLAVPTLPTVGLLPAVSVFGGVLLISIYHNALLILIAPLLAGSALGAALIARYHLEDESGQARRIARTAHVLLTHGVAFLVLATIYINKVRSLLSATAVAVAVCLLLVQIADGERFPAERRLIYGLVGGMILGEITWGLNYWPLTGWTGGAVLLIAFYLVAGLVLAQVREGLRRRDILEYGAIAALAFGIVAWSLR